MTLKITYCKLLICRIQYLVGELKIDWICSFIMIYKLAFCSLLFLTFLSNVLIADDKLKLLSGDIISIKVFGNKEFNQECRVNSKGYIKVLGAGKFSVIGKSDDQMEKEIVNGLIINSSLNKPQVLFEISKPIKRKIFVHGHFNKVQSVIVPYGQTLNLRQLVAEVGGFKAGADIENMQVIRHLKAFDKKSVRKIEINFLTLTEEKRPTAFLMEAGDVVFVVELPPVTVVGAVLKPGSVKINAGNKIDCLPLVLQMGGFKSDAQRAYYSLSRKGKTYILPYMAKSTSGASYQNELFDGIKPGDIIEVLSVDKVFVDGYVKSPGAFMAGNKNDLTVRKMIVFAGGAKEEAKLKKVKVVRTTSEGTTVRYVDVSKIKNKSSNEFIIKPGDYIYVPRSFY
ncbi:MAG: hypothetical protein COA79_15795 [Planctomycetota bacterium]|nr:MAG: hypothetical protein COA79_15795 [Planctomycetota bacterium]